MVLQGLERSLPQAPYGTPPLPQFQTDGKNSKEVSEDSKDEPEAGVDVGEESVFQRNSHIVEPVNCCRQRKQFHKKEEKAAHLGFSLDRTVIFANSAYAT